MQHTDVQAIKQALEAENWHTLSAKYSAITTRYFSISTSIYDTHTPIFRLKYQLHSMEFLHTVNVRLFGLDFS